MSSSYNHVAANNRSVTSAKSIIKKRRPHTTAGIINPNSKPNDLSVEYFPSAKTPSKRDDEVSIEDDDLYSTNSKRVQFREAKQKSLDTSANHNQPKPRYESVSVNWKDSKYASRNNGNVTEDKTTSRTNTSPVPEGLPTYPDVARSLTHLSHEDILKVMSVGIEELDGHLFEEQHILVRNIWRDKILNAHQNTREEASAKTPDHHIIEQLPVKDILKSEQHREESNSSSTKKVEVAPKKAPIRIRQSSAFQRIPQAPIFDRAIKSAIKNRPKRPVAEQSRTNNDGFQHFNDLSNKFDINNIIIEGNLKTEQKSKKNSSPFLEIAGSLIHESVDSLPIQDLDKVIETIIILFLKS